MTYSTTRSFGSSQKRATADSPKSETARTCGGKLYVIVKYVLHDEKRRYSTKGRGGGHEIHDIDLIKELAAKSIEDPGEDLLEMITKKLRGVHKDAMSILERRLEGLTPKEIADELGMGVRNVQRIIRLMRDAVDGTVLTR